MTWQPLQTRKCAACGTLLHSANPRSFRCLLCGCPDSKPVNADIERLAETNRWLGEALPAYVPFPDD